MKWKGGRDKKEGGIKSGGWKEKDRLIERVYKHVYTCACMRVHGCEWMKSEVPSNQTIARHS